MLDVGCGALGLRALEPELDITGTDLSEQPGLSRARSCGPTRRWGLPFADGEFDLVYCSSVIEHVPPASRAAFAAELRRVGRCWLVQTPAYSFPLEPHSLLPGAHWLPARSAPALLATGRRAGAGKRSSCCAEASWKRCSGPARAERLGPLAKSWIAIGSRRPEPHAPGRAGANGAASGRRWRAS